MKTLEEITKEEESKKLQFQKEYNQENYFFVGIDLSLTNTGLVILNEKSEIVKQELISTKPSDDIEKRLLEIEEKLSFIPNIVRLQNVYIEGLSFGSKGQSILELGALHYIVRIFLYKKNINYKTISPGTLKKFVTGKGNAKKNLMLMKVFKKWGIEFNDDNLCDAFSLAKMALEEYSKYKQMEIFKDEN